MAAIERRTGCRCGMGRRGDEIRLSSSSARHTQYYAGRADRVAVSRGKARVSWHLGTIPLTLQHALAQVRRRIVTSVTARDLPSFLGRSFGTGAVAVHRCLEQRSSRLSKSDDQGEVRSNSVTVQPDWIFALGLLSLLLGYS